MMRQIQRLTALVLIIAVCLGLLSANVWATESECQTDSPIVIQSSDEISSDEDTAEEQTIPEENAPNIDYSDQDEHDLNIEPSSEIVSPEAIQADVEDKEGESSQSNEKSQPQNTPQTFSISLYENGSGKYITSDEAIMLASPDKGGHSGLLTPMSSMSISQSGIEFIKEFESFKSKAYKALPSEQYWTIGYGHYGADVHEGMTITEPEASALLNKDLVVYCGYVNTFLGNYGISLSQKQYDSLVSFTYNVGNVWKNQDFSLKRYLIDGESKYSESEITTAFTNWNKSGGKVISGLTRRRKAEAKMFLEGRGNLPDPVCNCSTSYAGQYTCTSKSTLLIRTGHGTNYGSIGSIPGGATVTVTKGDGTWAHIEYNGLKGYASMQYLQRKSDPAGRAPSGYNISVPSTSVYNSDMVTVTIKAFSGEEITHSKFYVYYNGTTKSSEWKSENAIGIKTKNLVGSFTVYAEVKNSYGSYKGATSDGALKITVGKPNLGSLQNLGENFYAVLKNAHSGTVVDRDTSSNQVQGWSVNGGSNQSWHFIRQSDGSYKILSKSDESMALDVNNADYLCGTNVQAYKSNDSNAQRWFIYSAGNGAYYLRPACSDSAVLDLAEANSKNGTNVAIWTYNGGAAQKWKVEKTAALVSASVSSISLSIPGNTQKTITVTANGSLPDSYHFNVSRSSDCVSTEWTGGWKNSSHDLIVKGNHSGSGTLTINLVDANGDKTVATTSVAVNVSGSDYTVRYNANGGSGAPASQSKQYGKTLTLSSTKPTKNYSLVYNANGGTVSSNGKTVNCTFSGWNTNASGTGTSYSSGSSYTANANVTLYAQWKDPTAGTLPTPVKNGSVFNGWYTSASGGVEITSSSIITKNTTIYAHWSDHVHSYGSATVTKQPTCTEQGIRTYTCNCGDVKTEVINALGHSWDSGKITKSPTETQEGIKTYTCTRCQKTKTESVPPVPQGKQATIAVGSGNSAPGKEVTLPVSITKNPGIAGFALDINYDHRILTLNRVESDSKLGGSFSVNGDTVSWFADNNTTMTGAIFRMTFTVASQTSAEQTDVSLTMHGGQRNIANEDSVAISADFQKGTIRISHQTYGDVTGDGEVTIADVVKINRYVVGRINLTASELVAADVTGDGEVTIADVVRVNRYVIGKISTLIQEIRLIALSSGEDARIVVGSTRSKPGEQVSIPVTLSNNPGVAGLALTFTLPNGMTLNSIIAGDILRDGTLTQNGNTVTWYSTDNVSRTGVILNLNVTAPRAEGEYAIRVALRDGRSSNFTNEDSENVGVTFESGNLVVEKEQHTHTWDAGTVTKQPTYTEYGIKTYTCTVCGETKTESIAKLAPTSTPEPEPTPAPKIQTKLSATKLSKVKWNKKKKVIIVSWKKNSTGRGYEIQASTTKNFKKNSKTWKIKNKSTDTITIAGVPKGKYYIRIRTVNGKEHSAWSKLKTVKVTK